MNQKLSFQYSGNIGKKDTDYFQEVVNEAFQVTQDKGSINFKSITFNFNVFEDNLHLKKELNRDFPSNIIFISSFNGEKAEIVCDLSFIKSLKNDKTRKSRHLIHELIHIANWIESLSTKRNGDNNVNINIPEWLDEGVAEVLSCRVVGNFDLINLGVNFYNKEQHLWTKERVNSELNNLTSPNRGNAFLLSIGMVENKLAHEQMEKTVNHKKMLQELLKDCGQ